MQCKKYLIFAYFWQSLPDEQCATGLKYNGASLSIAMHYLTCLLTLTRDFNQPMATESEIGYMHRREVLATLTLLTHRYSVQSSFEFFENSHTYWPK